MKKYLFILLTLFSLSASAQVKVIKVQGAGGSGSGISESKVAQMISDSLATLDLSGYTKEQVDSIATVIRGEITGKVDKTTTITINGVTYDLSANRSWTISGGESSKTLYTADDSLTGDRTVDVKNHSLTFKSDLYPSGWFGYIPSIEDAGSLMWLGDPFDNQNNTSILVSDSLKNVQFNAGNGIIYNTPPSGASTDSVLTWDNATGIIRKRDASSFSIGGVTQTQLDDTANAIRADFPTAEGVSWGDITGSLPDQTDLLDSLNNKVNKTDKFPLNVVKPIKAIDSVTIGFDSLNLTEIRYSQAARDTATWTDSTVIDKKYLLDRLSTFTGGGGVTQSVISDTLKNYANSGSITTPNVLFTTPVSLSVSNHQLTGTLSLNSQSAYRLFGTGSSSGTPSFFTNNFSDSMKRSTDSVFRRVNGNWIFQYKDSVGSGSSGWGLTGTPGTTAGTNFIGTTDNVDFVVKTNNAERFRINAAGTSITSSGLSIAPGAALSYIRGARLRLESNAVTTNYVWIDNFGVALGSSSDIKLNLAGASGTMTLSAPTTAITKFQMQPIVQSGTRATVISGLDFTGAAQQGAPMYIYAQSNTNNNSVGATIFGIDETGAARGNILIGTQTEDASAKFKISSTTQGSIPAPKMTTTQRTAISSPSEGLQVYDTDLHKLYVYDGTTWQAAW